MEYKDFSKNFSDIVFGKTKANLIKNIASYPERYVGLFRPTKPKAKMVQNLTQSNEIKFGDAFELIVEKYFIENGYEVLNKRINSSEGTLIIDQLVQKDKIVFIEQKLRDDHDSSKKEGQMNNFRKKLSKLVDLYDAEKLLGYVYFIDPSLNKNKRYYLEELAELSSSYGVSLKLVYGKELYRDLGLAHVWEEIEAYLSRWRRKLPDLPDINFDKNAKETFEEIRCLDASIYRKLFERKEVIKEIFPILFPQRKTLKLLQEHFLTRDRGISKHIETAIKTLEHSRN